MKRFLIGLIFIYASVSSHAQARDPVILLQADNLYNFGQEDSFKLNCKSYLWLLANDFKQQATSPLRTKGNEWLKVGAFGLLTSGTITSDEFINQASVNLRAQSSFVRTVSPVITRFGGDYEVYTLGAIAAYSIFGKNEKLKAATVLASQAYTTSAIWGFVIKSISGRKKPYQYDPLTKESEPNNWNFAKFTLKNSTTGKSYSSLYTGFPSGHTTAAFAVATVYAKMYKDKPLVPILAYSAATLVGISRSIENTHWASEILAGSLLGYLCGTQVVNNYNRLLNRRGSVSKKRGTVDLNIGFSGKALMPEVVYTFR